ncbi:VOC family protein [Hoeflea sp. WL0058]|uniref:VOC family protein n=1 Tax=Flavimaribacter sediminis TaxID=2865987 RepID=A0AAE3D3I2_9HYPH|nr:VOC family protein [Flavimaribacter sediminis]MBW8639831.1 VOC family protein [Flavimaribacter sediminis]
MLHHPLDHVLWACADIDSGNETFEHATGVKPGNGGSHDGNGTRNTLVSLGVNCYFEIISIDPAQGTLGPRAKHISAITTPALHAFGVSGNDLDAYFETASELGLSVSAPTSMQRVRKDGVLVRWRAIYIEDPTWGYMIPFLIDWMDSEHPWKTTPTGCSLVEFQALHPEAERLRHIYEALGVDVPVIRSNTAGFLCRLNTPKGEVLLT